MYCLALSRPCPMRSSPTENQLPHQPIQNQATSHGIVRRPVMVEVRQAQSIGDEIQLELIQLGQQILGKNQGIRRGKAVGQTLPVTLRPDKAGVKIRIVGHQHPVPNEIQELRQR